MLNSLFEYTLSLIVALSGTMAKIGLLQAIPSIDILYRFQSARP